MIYPAELDIILLQNSTFKKQVRFSQNLSSVTMLTIVSGNQPVFTVSCHHLTAGTKVIFTNLDICGVEENTVYYVIATGLTANEFMVSATSGGSSITASGEFIETFSVAEPLEITGFTLDADVKDATGVQVATFTCAILAPLDGLAEISMLPETTLPLAPAVYSYDLSLTSSGGERYYWLYGTATVKATRSRN